MTILKSVPGRNGNGARRLVWLAVGIVMTGLGAGVVAGVLAMSTKIYTNGERLAKCEITDKHVEGRLERIEATVEKIWDAVRSSP